MAKRAASTKGRPRSAVRANENDPCDLPLFVDEADMASEKWGDASAKGKDKGKALFTDPCGQVLLPPSLHSERLEWRRPLDIWAADGASGEGAGTPTDPAATEATATLTAFSPTRLELTPAQAVTSSIEDAWARRKNQAAHTGVMEEPHLSFHHVNKHVLHSALVAEVAAVFSYLQRKLAADPHTARPWQNMFPQEKPNTPSYNPNGRYCVKLFFSGAWRKVYVDDLLPVDPQSGRVMMLVSPINGELWPSIICKAIFRLASQTYDWSSNSACEYGELNVLSLLTGWYPEARPITVNCLPDIVDRASAVCEANLSHQQKLEEAERKRKAEEEAAAQAALAAEEQRKSASSKRRSAKGGERKITKSPSSGRLTATGRSSTSGQPASPEASQEQDNEFIFSGMVFDPYRHDGEAMSLFGEAPRHTVRLRRITCLDRQPCSDPSRWILELESPHCFYRGPLGFGPRSSSAWTSAVAVALGMSREAAEARHAAVLALHEQGADRAPFRFFMFASDIPRFFRSFVTYHKVPSSHNVATLHLTSSGPVVKSRGEEMSQNCVIQDVDVRFSSPYWLIVDSVEETKLLCSFSMAQSHLQRPVTADKGDDNIVKSKPHDTTPCSDGQCIVSLFHWQTGVEGKPVFAASTAGTVTQNICLPPGLHLLRVSVLAGRGSLTLSSNKTFKFGTSSFALSQLSASSARAQQFIARLMQMAGVLMTGPLEDTDNVLELLAEELTMQPEPGSLLRQVTQASLWALSKVMGDKWAPHEEAFRELFLLLSSRALAMSKEPVSENMDVDTEPAATAPSRIITPRPLSFDMAAAIITRFIRANLLRVRHRHQTESRIKELQSLASPVWENVQVNMLAFGQLVLRRLMEQRTPFLNRLSFAPDLDMQASFKSYDSVFEPKTQNGPLSLLFDELIVVSYETRVFFLLELQAESRAGAMPSTFVDSSAASLVVVDNRTGTQVQAQHGGRACSIHLRPQPEGYSLYAPCRTPKSTVTWRLLALSSPTLGLEKIQQGQTPSMFSGALVDNNSGGFIGRHCLTYKGRYDAMLHASFAVPAEFESALVTLRISSDDSVPLASQHGFGMAQLSCKLDSTVDNSSPDSTLSERSIYLCVEVPGMKLPAVSDGDENDSEKKPASGRKTRSGTRKRAGTSAGSRDGLPTWKMHLCSKMPFTLADDDRRDKTMETIRAGWEAVRPGRRAQGTALRDKFKGELDQGEAMLDKTTFMPDPLDTTARYWGPELENEMDQQHLSQVQEFRRWWAGFSDLQTKLVDDRLQAIRLGATDALSCTDSVNSTLSDARATLLKDKLAEVTPVQPAPPESSKDRPSKSRQSARKKR